MADVGIKKVLIKKEGLPPLVKLAENVYGHFLRYRIISEDKNRVSYWSKMISFELISPNSLPLEVDGKLIISGSSITIIWDDDLNRPRYDIFVSFDDDDFFYHGTSPIHTYSIINTEEFSSVSVIIQIESADKEISEVLKICELTDTIES